VFVDIGMENCLLLVMCLHYSLDEAFLLPQHGKGMMGKERKVRLGYNSTFRAQQERTKATPE
jgi:hypothetical protein